jgi:hypothetical protein
MSSSDSDSSDSLKKKKKKKKRDRSASSFSHRRRTALSGASEPEQKPQIKPRNISGRKRGQRTETGSRQSVDTGSGDDKGKKTKKKGRTELGNQIEFLKDFKYKFKSPNSEMLEKTAQALLRFRTNPPQYLLDEANMSGGIPLYEFLGRKKTSRYVRSAGAPVHSGLKDKQPDIKGPIRDKILAKASRGSLLSSIDALNLKTNPEFRDTKRRTRGVGFGTRRSPGSGELYDKQLNYKNRQLKLLKEKLPQGGYAKIKPDVYNDYPCLMVDLTKITGNLRTKLSLDRGKPTGADKAAFSKFVMSYYTGLVNRVAVENGMNTLMTQRQSFGFATPSIADTADSFRVNLGMMPPKYTAVHLKAMELLNVELTKMMDNDGEFARGVESKIPNYDSYLRTSVTKDDEDEDSGNESDDESDASDESEEVQHSANDETDWRKFAFSKIEKSTAGKTGIQNITRNQWNLDNVNQMAFNGKSLNDSLKTNLANIHVDDKGKKLTSIGTGKNLYKKPEDRDAIDSHLPDLDTGSLDNHFGELLQSHREKLTGLLDRFPDQKELNTQFKKLVDDLTPQNSGLAYHYDLINDYLALYAAIDLDRNPSGNEVRGIGSKPVEESYGSESEAEDFAGDTRLKRKLKVKKIIANSGMDAIYSAIEHEIDKSGKNLVIDKKSVYYELDNKYIKAYASTSEDKPNATKLLLMDANPAVTQAGQATSDLSELDSSNAKIWVIDTTSSTQTQMQEIVDKFRTNTNKPERLYLVSSGFKNEQWGADKNSYGTVRIITDSDREGDIDDAIKKYRSTHKPTVEVAHAYRRLLKDLGFVPRDEEILRLPPSKRFQAPPDPPDQAFSIGPSAPEGTPKGKGKKMPLRRARIKAQARTPFLGPQPEKMEEDHQST